jgi:hypothetical protein
MPNIQHLKTNTIADLTGTVTVWNGVTTETVAATNLVRPVDWNASHAGGWDLAASNVTYSSGTVILSGGANVTVGTNAGQTITISAAAQTVQTQNLVAISASDALFSSGTVVMSGFGDVTVNTAAGTIRISAPVQTAQTGISGVANSETTYTSGTVNLSVVAGNLTIRSTTGQAFQFSMSQTVQVETQTFIGGVANSETTYTSGSVLLEGTNNITVFSTTGQRFRISAANSHAQQTGISAIQVSNTTYSSGTVTLQNANGISFGSSGANGISASYTVPTQTNQTGGIYVTAQSTGQSSSSTYDLRTLSFVPDGIISAGWSGGSFRVSATQSVQTQSRFNLTLAGNSTSAGAGYIQISSGVMTLAGGNNVTLSQNGNAVTVSAGAGGGGTLTLYATSNTTQSSTGTQAASSLIFAGAGVASVGVTNGSIVVSVPAGGGGGFTGGMSNLGNTAGTTGLVSNRLALVGSQGITLSQSVNGASATLTWLGPVISSTEPMSNQGSLGAINAGNGTLWVLPVAIPAVLEMDRIIGMVAPTVSSSSNSSHGGSIWLAAGIFTQNAATLSLLVSSSTLYAWTNTSNNSTQVLSGGIRIISTPLSTTLQPGQYWLGYVSQTSTVNANWFTVSYLAASRLNTNYSGNFMSSTDNSQQMMLGWGSYSATTAGSQMPSSMAFSNIRHEGAVLWRSIPSVILARSTV